MQSGNRSILFFYLLVGYIFASFLWWSYLLYQKNEQTFEAQVFAAKINYEKNSVAVIAFKKTNIYEQILKKHESQKWMILGEGSVFMILLLLGAIQLFRTFNKEVQLAKQQNNFLLSITHELKSPLASIKLSLQTLGKRLSIEEKFQKLIFNSLDDVERLQSLVDNILYAARMENSSYTISRQEENISEIIQILVDKFKLQAGNNRNIFSKIEPYIDYAVDKESFRSAVINLLENAYKYSSPQSLIEIHLFRKDNFIVFEVKDQGKGIAEQEKEKIFQKFYRIGDEATRNTKGTGLGLFIVKKVVEQHQGKISVANNEPQGSIFKIFLPDFSFNQNKIQTTAENTLS